MTESEKTKTLQNEIRTVAEYCDSYGGTPLGMVFKAYGAGIQYAIEVLVGKKAESILPEVRG